jgi:CheY-like chemotaxis protein
MHTDQAVSPRYELPATVARILVVDDDAAIRKALRMALEDEGYLVSEASDGARALEYLRSCAEPVVVLLDFMMPRMDGAAVLRAVIEDTRLATRNAYVLVSANYNTIARSCANLLASLDAPVLPKPLDLDDLLETVQEEMERVAPRPTLH